MQNSPENKSSTSNLVEISKELIKQIVTKMSELASVVIDLVARPKISAEELTEKMGWSDEQTTDMIKKLEKKLKPKTFRSLGIKKTK